MSSADVLSPARDAPGTGAEAMQAAQPTGRQADRRMYGEPL